jgi:hypothetical protein
MLYSPEQINQWKVARIPGEAGCVVWCWSANLQSHLDALSREFSGAPQLCFELAALIVHVRRKIDFEQSLEKFFFLLDTELDFFCRELNSRWLVAVADTLADYGDESERIAAMIPVLLINMTKLAETERLFLADASPDAQKQTAVQGNRPPLPLWDGISSYWFDCGDMPRNLFRRCRLALGTAPITLKIFDTLIERLQNNPNLLSRLAQYNPNFWK